MNERVKVVKSLCPNWSITIAARLKPDIFWKTHSTKLNTKLSNKWMCRVGSYTLKHDAGELNFG